MNDNIEYCPFCNANLQGELIPKKMQYHYGKIHGTGKVAYLGLRKVE